YFSLVELSATLSARRLCRVWRTSGLGEALKRGKAFLSKLESLLAVLLYGGRIGIGFDGGALGIGHQGQCTHRIRIDLQQTIGSILHFGGVASLLISAHQSFESIVFYDSVGILQEELLKSLCLGRRIGLASRIRV